MSAQAAERHGLGTEIEVRPDEARRSHGPKRRLHRLARSQGYRLLFWSGLATCLVPMAAFAPAGALPAVPLLSWPEAMLAVNLLLMLIVRSALSGIYPFRKPAHRTGSLEDGIVWLGNCLDATGAGCWLSDSDLRQHLLIFGTTGSGKTVFLLGFYFQAIARGSGVIFVDGKADNAVYWAISALARRAGREDDLLVINYLIPPPELPDKVTGRPTGPRTTLSNTTNPFADMSPEQARSQLVGMMRDSGSSGDMWKGRASAMLGNVLAYLCEIRDRSEIILDIDYIRRAIQLSYIVAASRRRDLPEEIVTPLRRYLAELPGYDDGAVQVTVPGGDPNAPVTGANVAEAQATGFEEETSKQHGFLLMQLTEVMSDLTDTYGAIFRTPLGEVDFQDVVFNRRILCVMLPALQADPDRLSGLGKLVVAGIRTALGGRALGTQIEGERRDVLDRKPTNAEIPFFIILDEYGYYSVPGFAVVAAQARSLGCSVLFVGQDYASFRRGDEKEAQSVVANTNTKVVMKIEDPEDTHELMRKRGGSGIAAQGRGLEKEAGSLRAADGASYERIDRINLRDLVGQRQGEAHVIHGDDVVRVSLCYMAPEKLAKEQEESELALFLPVRDLTTGESVRMVSRLTSVTRLFEGAPEPPSASGSITVKQFFATLKAVAREAPPADWLEVLIGINAMREVADAADMAAQIEADSQAKAEAAPEAARRTPGRRRAESPFTAFDDVDFKQWQEGLNNDPALDVSASQTRRTLAGGEGHEDPDVLLSGHGDEDEEEYV